MSLEGLKIGFALTGSFCTFSKVLPEIDNLKKEGADIYPIISNSTDEYDTRFGLADTWKKQLTDITGKKPASTIVEVEPIGPGGFLDAVIVAPCTGNTLAKLANAVTDTPVTMAVKAQLRNSKPVIIAISTNDGLGANAKNLGLLLNSKYYFFVPFKQDDPIKKCNSLIAKMDLIVPTLKDALQGKQIQPLLI